MTYFLTSNFQRMEDQVLKKVMSQCLGREANLQDYANHFQIVESLNHPGRTFIGFHGSMIGELSFHIDTEGDQVKGSCVFTPKTQID